MAVASLKATRSGLISVGVVADLLDLQGASKARWDLIERWVGSVRRECLDRLLIFNRRQLERILRVYVRHYNEQRPHRALALQAPDPPAITPIRTEPGLEAIAIRRRDLLGGLIHEYEATAAA